MAQRRQAGRRKASGARSTQLPKERGQFIELTAANPNYFGNWPQAGLKPVKKMAGNTTYEDLTCIGFNLDLSLLEATIQIKLPYGFLGGLCSAGSIEYVRFYVDYGAGWQDVGVASVDTHDLPNILDCYQGPDKPLSYVVTLAFTPQTDVCSEPVTPAVRGILSWNFMPPAGTPNWPPVWGNVLDQHIQAKPRGWVIGDLVEIIETAAKEVELPPGIEEAWPHPIPIPDPPPLTVAQLAELYAGESKQTAARAGARTLKTIVEPHRFGTSQLHAALASQGSGQTLVADNISHWASIGLSWEAALAGLAKTQANVTYEELECLGLDYDRERLVATLRIKRPTGYSGDLCHLGSVEYVAFWADWNDECKWTYVGTAQVRVHDIAKIPAGGLTYSAVMPVDVNAIRRPCTEPRISRIRAVLSWATPPSTVDSNALQYWGNSIDAHIQVRPGQPITQPGAIVWEVGGIRLDDIDVFGNGMTKPFVKFALFGWAYADEWFTHGRTCPFGGTLIIKGPSVLGYKYRFWAQDVTAGTPPALILDPFYTVPPVGPPVWRTPNPVTGFSNYLNPLTQNIENVLAYWTPGGDHLWQFCLDVYDLANNYIASTPWYSILLDNTGPRRKPVGEAPIITDTMDIHIDGGGDCKDFTVGTPITGRFVARDLHFGAFSLQTLPVSLAPSAPSPSSGIIETAPALPGPGGNTWSLSTTGLQPCGYVVQLQVWDRSIVSSYPGSHNANYTDVGFCLRAK